MYRQEYGDVFAGNEAWNAIPVGGGDLCAWNAESSYIHEPPFFVDLSAGSELALNAVKGQALAAGPVAPQDIRGAKVLAYLGDSVTTDHISPAGPIEANSPAGRYLIGLGVPPGEFNQYGTRRGNHEVMMRGTFANIRIRNKLVPGVEGGYTVYQGSGVRGQGAGGRRQEAGVGGQPALPARTAEPGGTEVMSIYDAAMKYQAAGVPTIVLAGKEYGTGSSRDWAAKGPYLLGVKAVIAESFERIHRSNLAGMGILPLQFLPEQNATSLGLTGTETFDIVGSSDADMQPKQRLIVRATAADGSVKTFEVISRIDTPVEARYYRNGGILQTVLRQILKSGDC
jgi:aconitate hydratase